MHKTIFCFIFVVFIVSNAIALDPDMARFCGAKRKQAIELAGTQTDKVPSIVWSFFDAVRVDDWETATNLGAKLREIRFDVKDKESSSTGLQTAVWPVISETLGAYEQFHEWDNKWLRRFGNDIIRSVPKGSIYFGGTDPGRFVISALCENQREGVPFFVLTQNQLADPGYMNYLSTMYGGKIKLPSTNDVQAAFTDYMADAGSRFKTGKLKPGEFVSTNADGRLQVSGQVAVMTINGLLAKDILDENPDRDFYIEESFPLEWMYPCLSPHGLIMQLHRQPLKTLDEKILQEDRQYWTKLMAEVVGDWLTEKTTLAEVCKFNEETYVSKNLANFKGSVSFARNTAAQKTFGKLRCSIAGVYEWRMEQANDSAEKERMRKEADLAYRQSLVCCPYSPETVARYIQFLLFSHRLEDAKQLAKTAMHADPENEYFKNVLSQLQRL